MSTSGTGLLFLPAELREEIYTIVVTEPSKTISMLPSHAYYANEVSAAQPAICRVSKQLRAEALSMFYSTNTFTSQLDNPADLAIATSWLRAIGNINVRRLKRIVLCGWTRTPMGHMVSRRWVSIMCDLWTGGLVVEKGGGEHPDVVRRIEGLRRRFADAVVELGEQGWGVRELGELMEGFAGLCVGY